MTYFTFAFVHRYFEFSFKVITHAGQHPFSRSLRADKYCQIIGVADEFVPSVFQLFIKLIQEDITQYRTPDFLAEPLLSSTVADRLP